MNAVVMAPGVISTAGKYYFGVEEVMEYLSCRKSKAYEIIRTLRKELIDSGKLTPTYPQGKIPKKYFMSRCMIEE